MHRRWKKKRHKSIYLYTLTTDATHTPSEHKLTFKLNDKHRHTHTPTHTHILFYSNTQCTQVSIWPLDERWHTTGRFNRNLLRIKVSLVSDKYFFSISFYKLNLIHKTIWKYDKETLIKALNKVFFVSQTSEC